MRYLHSTILAFAFTVCASVQTAYSVETVRIDPSYPPRA